ncbi:hypothetical protein CC78DRAFT_531528 [Lojkania enalia]|uniref:Zn(2)-C6 fungal-type domain-containing protein n=1 Tax=Lojkania enalia TaxID=147567 RepID=A0A9P4KEA8_9PLEO|nr:hypothetical protein CC78DRAFT_531528 [Didymosphaeria enalia]
MTCSFLRQQPIIQHHVHIPERMKLLGDMSDAMPRTLKLRSSCDRCGAAKLKCDRARPECGRCRSLGQICVYGFSRKSGKPRRAKPAETQARSADASHVSQTDVLQGDLEMDMLRDANGGVDDSNSSVLASIDAPEIYGSLLEPSLAALMSLDFDGPAFSQYPGDCSLLETAGHPTQTTVESPTQQSEKNTYINNASMGTNKGHDCPREAYDVLGSLSFLNLNQMALAPTSSMPVPLDHALRVNREAGERLGRLLTCSCARSPHLALLYASIFSRIMIWYQQAVGCNQSASWSPATAVLETALRSASTSTSTSGSGSPWLSVAVSSGSTGTPTLTQATGLAVAAPTQMAIGSFNIDDPRMQTVLRKQLVLSEMKRASYLIDLFASQSADSKACADENALIGVDALYRSLTSWLRDEHSRIVGIMRSKLREFSDTIE